MWLVMGGGTVAFWVAVMFAVRCGRRKVRAPRS